MVEDRDNNDEEEDVEDSEDVEEEEVVGDMAGPLGQVTLTL